MPTKVRIVPLGKVFAIQSVKTNLYSDKEGHFSLKLKAGPSDKILIFEERVAAQRYILFRDLEESTNIIVKKRSDDFHVCLENHAEIWSAGASANSAIGNFIMAHPDAFGINFRVE